MTGAAGPAQDARIAVVPGDGIGIDVPAEAVKVLETVAAASGRGIGMTRFDWGAEAYLRSGVSLPEGALQMLQEGFDAILLGARELGQAQGVPVVDVARKLPKSSRYFYDFVHFTSDGAQAVAGLAARALCPVLAERFPQHAARPCPEAEAR